MSLLLFIAPYVLFIAVFAVLKHYYTHRTIVEDNVLEEALKTADQYEIAYLKRGKNLVIQLAFYHLLKAGYFKRWKSGVGGSPKYLFQAMDAKDDSQLSDIEKAVLMQFVEPSSLANSLAKELPLLERFCLKFSRLKLFYPAKNTIEVLWKIYVILAWGASLAYLIFGAPHVLSVRIFLIALANIYACNIVWGNILGRNNYLDGYFLSSSGKRYIKLFERKYFPLPDFKSDTLYKEAEECNPCSV